MKNQVIKLCKNILHAHANNDLRVEQREYEKLRAFCDKNNINFDNALEGGISEAQKSIAVQMRGL